MAEAVIRVVDCHVFYRTEEGPVYLLLRRAKDAMYPDSWRMVGGKIEPGEKAYETAYRELQEETGLHAHKLWAVPFTNAFYEPSHDRINLIPVFAAEVLSQDVRLSKEHQSFEWMTYEEAVRALPWPAQRKGLRIVEDFIVRGTTVSHFVEIELPSK
jgi:dATP pyrophosphohydrolase